MTSNKTRRYVAVNCVLTLMLGCLTLMWTTWTSQPITPMGVAAVLCSVGALWLLSAIWLARASGRRRAPAVLRDTLATPGCCTLLLNDVGTVLDCTDHTGDLFSEDDLNLCGIRVSALLGERGWHQLERRLTLAAEHSASIACLDFLSTDGRTRHLAVEARRISRSELHGVCYVVTVRQATAQTPVLDTDGTLPQICADAVDGILLVRATDAVITDVNAALLSLLDRSRAATLGLTVQELGEQARIQPPLHAHPLWNAADGTRQHSLQYAKDNGEVVTLLASSSTVLRDSEPYTLLMFKDISSQRATEQLLRARLAEYRNLFSEAPLGMLVTDLSGVIQHTNTRAEQLLNPGDVLLKDQPLTAFVSDPDRAEVEHTLHRLLNTDEQGEREVCRVHCQTNPNTWVHLHAALLRGAHGQPEHFLVQIADITEVKDDHLRLQEMAFQDPLTELANRRLFQERLQYAVERATRGNHPAALLYLDIDHFKQINDNFGHDGGDNLLREAADRLRGCVRREDTVGRMGGDEFTVLLAQIATPADAGLVAQKIIHRLREPYTIKGELMSITASIGIALLPSDSADPNDLLRFADRAMYRAKQRGRNNYQYHANEHNIQHLRHRHVDLELQQALKCDALELRFAPQVNAHDEQVVGVRVYPCWHHAEQGLLGPDAFLSDGHDHDTLVQISRWILGAACEACQALESVRDETFTVCVPLTCAQWRLPGLADLLMRQTMTRTLQTGALQLALEGHIIDWQAKAVQENLQALTRLGIRLAVSEPTLSRVSVQELEHLPIDTLYLDAGFCSEWRTEPNPTQAQDAVIALARALGMRVIKPHHHLGSVSAPTADTTTNGNHATAHLSTLSLTELLALLSRERISSAG